MTYEDAEKKARYLVGLVQGTMALESQGLDKGTIEEMVKDTKEKLMDREKMIDVLVEDLPDFLKRDAGGFWDHVSDMERIYLRAHSDKEIKEMYEDVIS